MMRLFACAAVLVLVPCLARAQEPTVAVPANIKVEGMPPIPQSLADGLAKYSKFREAQMLGWHPTRRQILIMSTLGDAPQLYTVDAPGRAPAALTSLPQPGVLRLPNLFAAFDPADPNTLVFPRVQNGAQSLYRYDLTTSQASLVADTQSRYYAVWSRRGSWLAYDSAERNKTDHDLYVMRPADPKSARRIAEVIGLWAPEDWSPDGTMVLASELVSNFERYIWVINVKTGEKKAITPRDGNSIAWFDPRFSVDGKKVYAISDKGDRARVWRCDLATGAWTPVTSDSDRIDTTTPSPGFELSSDGQMIAVLVDRGSTNELQLIDLGTMKKRPMPALPAGQTNFITYLEQTEAARQENRRQEFGDERDPEMRNYLLSISPITRASDLKKPTYILHPGKDVRVPVSQAQELVTALKGNHATVWYAEFVEATHETFPGSAAGNDFMLASWMWFFKNFVLN